MRCPPAQSASLIVAYALLVQGYAVWKLRRAISLRRLLPFVLGSAVGIPTGLAVLQWAPTTHLRVATGVLLILFSTYNLLRPTLPNLRRAGAAGDAGVGVVNGLLAGATGLGGILPTIWCGLRGWTRTAAGAGTGGTATGRHIRAPAAAALADIARRLAALAGGAAYSVTAARS